MKLKFILVMGIISMLFGCDKRKSLGGNYYLNEDKNIIQYRYTVGGALRWYYKDLHLADIKTFKAFSNFYATDKNRIYFAGEPVKGISPNGFQISKEYPNLFAKNTKSKLILYKDSIIDIDFHSAKIHSPNYISDNDKVVFIAKRGVSKYGQFHKVPVTDVSSFGEFKTKSINGTAIGYDKYHIYLNAINTKIPSSQAQIIQLGFPSIILQNDVLHYIYSSYRNKETTFEDLQPPFKSSAKGLVDSFMYDKFYHFEIEGFKQAKQIANSSWITDTNGLYFIAGNRVHKVSNKQHSKYDYDEQHPKYLTTNDSLFQIQTYPYKVICYSTKAEILKDGVVKDQKQIYYNGELVKRADAETFTKHPTSGGFVDKNFYYPNNNLSYKKPIPNWAYQEFLNGKNPNDLFGIDMKFKHTVYKTYWNGFLVSLSMPTQENESNTVLLAFKNISRKVITLEKPLEEQLYVSYKPHNRGSPVVYSDKKVTITKTDNYNFRNIKNEERVNFILPINQQMITKLTVEVNGQEVLPSLILSDIDFVLERNDYNLYIEASNN
jgi:hypothetical protein